MSQSSAKTLHNPKKRTFEFPHAAPITTPEEAKEVAKLYINGENYKLRAWARRMWLIAHKGGRCFWSGCQRQARDYRYVWWFDFDHVYDLEHYKLHPVRKYKQFHISGNACARRSWRVVANHANSDTVLLCREHHNLRTQQLKQLRIETITGDSPRALSDIRASYTGGST